MASRTKTTTAPLEAIRVAIITALFSDDKLYDHLALKGGNALRLIYKLQHARTSLDLDLSLDSELEDLEATRSRLLRALHDRLDSLGYVAFDEKLEEKPPNAEGQWGGYRLTFKVISKADYERLQRETTRLRREAVTIGPSQERSWLVEISKYEYCEGKLPAELDSQAIYVYSPEMIVIEKLRAICQQMPEYPHRSHNTKTPRARDFYDIHSVIGEMGLALESPANVETARAIFRAKDVPLRLLREIRHQREFHAVDWPSVEVSVGSSLRAFDYYFDFVAALAERLEPLWVE